MRYKAQIGKTVLNCVSCNSSFLLTHSVQKYCNSCSAESAKEKAKERNRKYREKKHGSVRIGSKIHCKNCKNEFLKSSTIESYCDKCKIFRNKKQTQAAKEYIKKYRSQKSKDFIYVMKRRIRNTINQSIRRKKYGKESLSQEILGCSWEEFSLHLERQFSEGMSWDNRGEWEIDHILPLGSAMTYDEIVALNHYTNLRPLWRDENRKKSDKLHFLI